MSQLKFQAIDIARVLGPPRTGFEIRGKFIHPNQEAATPSAIMSPMARLFYQPPPSPEFLVQTWTPISLKHPMIFPKGGPVAATLLVLLDRTTIAAIERTRPRTGGTLDFRLEVSLASTGEFRPVGAGREPDFKTFESCDVTAVGPDERMPLLRVSRDEWNAMLKTFGFSEVETFELPVYRLGEEKVVVEAIRALRDAETSLRSGKNPGVLEDTRKAFEALATTVGGSGDIKAAFKTLWERALPLEKDVAKREPLDDLVGALAEFQHLGRHLKSPFTPIDPSDALLSLRLTLAIFEYLGVRLAETT